MIKGDYDLASQKYADAKKIQIIAFGPKHESVAETTAKLAMINYMNRDLDEAMTACTDVLSFHKLGKNHMTKGDAHCVLGYVHSSRRKVRQAIKSYTEALKIYRANNLGENDPKVQAMIKNIKSLKKK